MSGKCHDSNSKGLKMKLINGDCLIEMKNIEDNSIDMILCDLPYGTTKCKWDNVIPFEPLWEQYERIIKDNGAIVLFSSQPFTSSLIMSKTELYKYCWTWDKIIPRGHLVAKIRPMQRTEDICVFGKKKINYFPIMIPREKPISGYENKRTEIMGGKSKSDKKTKTYTHKYPQTILSYSSHMSSTSRLHPTQKPVELLKY